MILSVDSGVVTVPMKDNSTKDLNVCVVWLENWKDVSYELQKEIFIFVEHLYKHKHIFYCQKKGSSVFDLLHPKSSSTTEHLSEGTLKKVFVKYVHPKIQKKSFKTEEIHLPKHLRP